MDNINENTAQSPLLRFSAELRNHIYRLILVSKTDMPLLPGSPPKEPPLLAVNRQSRREGLGIFWAENTFRATEAVVLTRRNTGLVKTTDDYAEYTTETSVLRRFLQDIKPQRASLITCVRLIYSNDCESPMGGPEWGASWRYASPEDLVRHWCEPVEDIMTAKDIETAAKSAARLMLRALSEDGLNVHAVEPMSIHSSTSTLHQQWFQKEWIQSVESAKKTIDHDDELRNADSSIGRPTTTPQTRPFTPNAWEQDSIRWLTLEEERCDSNRAQPPTRSSCSLM